MSAFLFKRQEKSDTFSFGVLTRALRKQGSNGDFQGGFTPLNTILLAVSAKRGIVLPLFLALKYKQKPHFFPFLVLKLWATAR